MLSVLCSFLLPTYSCETLLLQSPFLFLFKILGVPQDPYFSIRPILLWSTLISLFEFLSPLLVYYTMLSIYIESQFILPLFPVSTGIFPSRQKNCLSSHFYVSLKGQHWALVLSSTIPMTVLQESHTSSPLINVLFAICQPESRTPGKEACIYLPRSFQFL